MSTRRPPPGTVRIAALRGIFRTVGSVAPGVAARWAEDIFCRPPRQEARPVEERYLETGSPFTVSFEGDELRAWSWGSGPLVILAHGWGSRAGRWAALAPMLVERGFRVVTYDAPAHGRSPGRRASLPEFSRALEAVAGATGPVHGLVGHSLGAAAIALALGAGLPAERAVLLASPADPEVFADRFAATLAISDTVRATMQRNLETRLQMNWKSLHLPTVVAGLRTPALVIHDRDDPDISPADAEAIAAAWPGARLMLTNGLGHRAIIRAPAVLGAAAAFLSDPAPPAR